MGQFESNLFDFKSRIFYQKRKEFCYAGDWSLYLNLATGDLKQCYCGKHLGNIYKDAQSAIPIEAIGRKCSLPHCYNGHAFLTLGDIPELDTPTYLEMRNRRCADGSEWVVSDMKAFMSTKLCESNREYSRPRKMLEATRNNYWKFRQKIHKIKMRILSRD